MVVIYKLNILCLVYELSIGILKTKYGIIGYQLNQHGIPLSDLFAEEIHNGASQYDRFREDDVVVATYAKSGTKFNLCTPSQALS